MPRLLQKQPSRMCGLLSPRSVASQSANESRFWHRFQLAEMHNPLKTPLSLPTSGCNLSDLVMLLPVWLFLQPACQATSC